MHKKIAFDDNLLSFPYVINGFDSLPCFIAFVKNVILRDDQSEWRYLVTENLKSNIPQELFPIIEFVPHDTVLIALKTIDPKYIAATMRSSLFKAKRMNSAQFCYKVLDYLQEKFAGRFSVYEQTDITKIRLYEDQSILEHADGNIASQEVVLCTNAYKHFSIWDEVNQRAFTKLHETITPRIGYLAAFPNPSPERYALGFFNEKEDVNPVPFWYFSHAPHPNHNPNHSCVIGGPEFVFEGTCTQDWIENKAELSLEFIHHFLKTTFQEAPDTLPFFWHGWMAYTPDGLRWVGPDSDHPHLWYNLGCNGIGIVPAITGAKKIASFMRNALNTSQFNH
jgi:glycine/D-amino acid oxidase-like deaminating enzyme